MMIDCKTESDTFFTAMLHLLDAKKERERKCDSKREISINVSINFNCNGKRLINPARFK